MKTNHCVWPPDSAACIGSRRVNLQHVTVPSKTFVGQATTCSLTNKPWAAKAIIKGNRSGSFCPSHPDMVLASVCFTGRVWFSQTPGGHLAWGLKALFYRWLWCKWKLRLFLLVLLFLKLKKVRTRNGLVIFFFFFTTHLFLVEMRMCLYNINDQT